MIALTLVVLASRSVRDRPEDLGLRLDGVAPASTSEGGESREPDFTLAEAKATRAYWLLVLATALSPMIGTALLFDIQPLFVARGLDPAGAATAVGAWSVTMAALALPCGNLVDRVAPRWLALAGITALAAGCALWLVVGSALAAAIAVAAHGVGQSLLAPTVSASAARFFGRLHHGAIRSSAARIGIVATGLGPLAFGVSHRLSGDYDAALVGFLLACVPAAVGSLWLAAPSQRADRAALCAIAREQ